MAKTNLQQTLDSFAAKNPDSNIALMSVESGVVSRLGKDFNLGNVGDNTVLVLVPEIEGEMDESQLEGVAGGLGDKSADCDKARNGANTMTIINL